MNTILYCALMIGGLPVSQEATLLLKGPEICDMGRCTRDLVVRFKHSIEVVRERQCIYKKPQGTIIAKGKK